VSKSFKQRQQSELTWPEPLKPTPLNLQPLPQPLPLPLPRTLHQQESVWTRLKKTTDIMVGKADQRPFPAALEREADLKQWSAADTSENSAKLGQDVKVAAA